MHLQFLRRLIAKTSTGGRFLAKKKARNSRAKQQVEDDTSKKSREHVEQPDV